MKTKNIYTVCTKLLAGLILFTSASCERDPSDDVALATFSANGDVFIDAFSSGLDYFPFGDSYLEAFTVDNETHYMGAASMRIDVPAFGIGYAGASFVTDAPRDLSGYDALTFYAKASKGCTINEIGFGIDGATQDKYRITLNNLNISTKWQKYTIAIPDASKLINERGLFWYSEGAVDPNDEGGYIFWIDELKFEKLGTIAQPRPAILNGVEETQDTFIGVEIPITGLTQTFNLGNGKDQTLNIAPSYFSFNSSNPSVASVNSLGVVTVHTKGSATISATLNGTEAEGLLQINSLGNFTSAPMPTQNPTDVIAVFSDAYTNIGVDFYNGYFGSDQTTLGGNDLNIDGDQIIKYTNLNFVAIQFANNVPTVNATDMGYLHVDIQVGDSEMASGDYINIQLADFGANNTYGGGDDTLGSVKMPSTDLAVNKWVSLDIPITDFTGLASASNLAQILFVSDGTISTILVDNIYFYK